MEKFNIEIFLLTSFWRTVNNLGFRGAVIECMIKIPIVNLLLVSVIGCASVNKEIYFVDAKKSIKKTTHYLAPDHSFSTGQININSTESVSINARITNSASGTYLLGVLIPIIPVFWWPGAHFSLVKENIQIACTTSYFPGKNFWNQEAMEHSDCLQKARI